MDDKDSFAMALKRAREIASKMQINARPTDDPSGKRINVDPENTEHKKRLALQIASNLSRSRIPKEIRVLSQGLNRDGDLVVNMMIPTILVCLFAGKNNETLAWMQDSSGVKMEMDLEHPYANSNEKPLTIIGSPDKVESARGIVTQYIREKDELLGINANNMQVSLGIEYSELLIPKEAVGLVIGKQGENIKKVNNETGCTVKFRPPGPLDDDRYRICTFHGTTTQIKKAREQISELVEFLKQKFGLARPVPKPGQEFAEVRVSAAKAGIVIGKGGETIKQINNLSGATVCIDRSVPDGVEFRTFFVVGSHQQVEHAKYLIREKSGETVDLPIGAIMALNPMMGMDPFANQPPCPPMFSGQPPQFPYDPTIGLQPPWYTPDGNPPEPCYSYQAPQPEPHQQYHPQPVQQEPPQDYTAAWAAYYQQYYSCYPQQGVEGENSANPPTSEASTAEAAAYWQSYYQQYYAQNPEQYNQYLASLNQQQSDPTQYPSVTHNPQQRELLQYPVIAQNHQHGDFSENFQGFQNFNRTETLHETLPSKNQQNLDLLQCNDIPLESKVSQSSIPLEKNEFQHQSLPKRKTPTENPSPPKPEEKESERAGNENTEEMKDISKITGEGPEIKSEHEEYQEVPINPEVSNEEQTEVKIKHTEEECIVKIPKKRGRKPKKMS